MYPYATLAYGFALGYTTAMAEITYQDVQRAVQEATRGIQNDLQRLSNTIVTIANQAQFIDDLQRSVQELRQEVERHDPRTELAMQQLQRDIQELKQQSEMVERLCTDISTYFHAQSELRREDEEYRRISPGG